MQATYALSDCLKHHTGSVCLSETWISPCSVSFSRSKCRVNGLERYNAVRAAYSSLDSRNLSCRAIEMLGRALVAQTFVTASLGAVFSYRSRSPRSFSDVAATGKDKVGGGRNRFLMACFTKKTGANYSRKNSGSYLESKSDFFMSPSLQKCWWVSDKSDTTKTTYSYISTWTC